MCLCLLRPHLEIRVRKRHAQLMTDVPSSKGPASQLGMWLGLTTSACLLLACSDASVSAAAPSADPASVAAAAASTSTPGSPALPVVTKDSQTLIFTFVDERGRNQVVSSIDEVPDGVKERV